VTSATTKGGRNGRAMLDNGALALAMAAPKEIGGAGDGHNPEQLFALGIRPATASAIMLISKNTASTASRAGDCEVTLDQKDGASALPSNSRYNSWRRQRQLQQLVEEAHTVCPYSKATKGNIPVKLTVVLRQNSKERVFYGYPCKPDRIALRKSSAPSSTCSSKAICRRSERDPKPKTAATVLVLEVAQLSANPRWHRSRWTHRRAGPRQQVNDTGSPIMVPGRRGYARPHHERDW